MQLTHPLPRGGTDLIGPIVVPGASAELHDYTVAPICLPSRVARV